MKTITATFVIKVDLINVHKVMEYIQYMQDWLAWTESTLTIEIKTEKGQQDEQVVEG